jgi:hypothetical protein
MLGVNLAWVVLLGQAAMTPDPSELVTRLGSLRYVEREEAAGALERLGRLAIPALRAAREARDAEIRTRAAALFNKIEGALLTQPTLVSLDFDDQPLAEVTKAISDQTGIKLGLIPENPQVWAARRITLQEPLPIPFWKAMDRLCDASRLQYNLAMNGSSAGREPVLPLHDGGPRPAGPTWDSGPFRVSLLSLHYQRDVNFSHVVVGFPRRGVMPPLPRPVPPQPPVNTPQADVAAISEQFYAQVQVAAEPRLAISLNGPLKVLEAVDERGQSLLPEPGEGPLTQRFSGYFGLNTVAIQVQAPLKRPAQPGQSIRKLRGTLPVLVSTRKPDPLVVALPGAAGKAFQNDDVTLNVVEIKNTPVNNQTSIEIVLRSNQNAAAGLPVPGGNGPEFMAQRPDLHQQQLEVVDTQGRPIGWYHQASTFDAEGSRMTLTLTPHDPQTTPAELRYYGLARAATEVSFEFGDIPMP